MHVDASQDGEERLGACEPVTAGTGRGCVSDEMSEDEVPVKVEGCQRADALLADKAGRDASLDSVKNKRRSPVPAGKRVGADVVTARLRL